MARNPEISEQKESFATRVRKNRVIAFIEQLLEFDQAIVADFADSLHPVNGARNLREAKQKNPEKFKKFVKYK